MFHKLKIIYYAKIKSKEMDGCIISAKEIWLSPVLTYFSPEYYTRRHKNRLNIITQMAVISNIR